MTALQLGHQVVQDSSGCKGKLQRTFLCCDTEAPNIWGLKARAKTPLLSRQIAV